jgi:hypothetical protein
MFDKLRLYDTNGDMVRLICACATAGVASIIAAIIHFRIAMVPYSAAHPFASSTRRKRSLVVRDVTPGAVDRKGALTARC